MKMRKLLRVAFSTIALLVFVLSPVSARAASGGYGTVVVKRAANFGLNLYVDVYVDGHRADRLQLGHKYVGELPAGRHEIMVDVPQRRHDTSTAVVRIHVHPGKSHTLVAGFSGQELVLRRAD